ncbi:DsbA family protein [Halorubrum sp. FL23]|uniref:DsbA family protein n=1 Tax=Halorubrum sp. FL23 TaxID=3458704 RepID=UPI0040337413
MVIFMGSYSGGDYSSDDEDSQDEGSSDDHSQPGLDDYGGDDGDDDSEQESGSGAGSAAAGAAGAAGAAAGAGAASGGAGVGAGAGAGAGTGTGTEPAEDGDSGDTEEPDDGESAEREDEEGEQPDSPDIEEPDIEPEDDVDDPESEKESEEEDAEEEEEDETVVVVQEVDALSAMSWGVQPVMKRVEECYSEEIDLFYKPAPVREVDPEQEKQKWINAGQQLGMPVNPSFWDEDPPESTELVNKAFEAAIEQYRGMDYIRALWRRGVAAGRGINDEDVLIELASDIGLDQEQFVEDLDRVEVETGERGELPLTFMEIQGKPAPKNGRVRYSDFKTQFTFQGIDEQEPQELQRFIEEYGPVATPEVMEVYGVQREESIQLLQDLNSVSSFEVGGEQFWML